MDSFDDRAERTKEENSSGVRALRGCLTSASAFNLSSPKRGLWDARFVSMSQLQNASIAWT